jgi:hypothetical protein
VRKTLLKDMKTIHFENPFDLAYLPLEDQSHITVAGICLESPTLGVTKR